MKRERLRELLEQSRVIATLEETRSEAIKLGIDKEAGIILAVDSILAKSRSDLENALDTECED